MSLSALFRVSFQLDLNLTNFNTLQLQGREILHINTNMILSVTEKKIVFPVKSGLLRKGLNAEQSLVTNVIKKFFDDVKIISNEEYPLNVTGVNEWLQPKQSERSGQPPL